MTIDLYYTPWSPNCRAVQLTAKLLGIDINLKRLQVSKKEQLTSEFIKINPQHTVPTLVDNEFVIWESYAIITYLAEQYGKDASLYPTDPKQRALVNQKFYFDMGTLYHRFAEYYYPMVFKKTDSDPEKKAKFEEAANILEYFLEGHEFVVGNNMTLADISLAATIATFDALDFNFTPYKNITQWYGKMKNLLPGFDEISGKDVLTQLIKEKK
ncbi:hypothetical protein ILUMI_25246 [Ignelater luminosus]|uniref:Glutathione S-transferase n=1 Tax=Ignelater luminosus TaxID=2038154 RepID=A0A8K0FY18_IGNLU|nr:hypothetical protein ILUMI_25246 [Ignelater luminosus]